MDITKKDKFKEVYDDILIEKILNSSLDIESVQEIVLDILDNNKQLNYNDKLVWFIKNAIENWEPLNWLTWEMLFNIFWQEFENIFKDKDTIEKEKRDNFISDYRNALFYSNLYNTKTDVMNIVSRVLFNDNTLDEKDSLTSFIKKSLNNWVPINHLTWDELTEAFTVNIPWVKIISDRVTIKDLDLNLMNWTSFIYQNKMLVFEDWKMFYCDISKCDKSNIINNNDHTIKRCMHFMNENYKISKRIMEVLVEQCKGFYPLKDTKD